MPKRKKQPETGDETQPPYTFHDEATKKKMKRHISDINDVISENDIENVKIPGKEKKPRPRKKKLGATEVKPSATEGSPATPWDVVD